jgi:ethanolamine ammonia-lyase small subunit
LISHDSLGIYVTHAPFKGRNDAGRNCISNVRPEGLSYAAAAFKLAWLVREALGRGLTGVDLKDESDLASLAGGSAARLSGPEKNNRAVRRRTMLAAPRLQLRRRGTYSNL